MIRRPWRTSIVLMVVGAALAATSCAGLGQTPAGPSPQIPASAQVPASPHSTPETSPSVATTPTATTPKPAEPRGVAPAAVTIAGLGIEQPLVMLGLARDGSLEVPTDYGDIGWFSGGGQPGGRGPVVLVGHVDSPTGPAVFARLAELRPGDMIELTDIAGGFHRYRVTRSVEYAKAGFPSAEVFGATAGDELRLITCSGAYDRGAGGYLANRIVSAVRI